MGNHCRIREVEDSIRMPIIMPGASRVIIFAPPYISLLVYHRWTMSQPQCGGFVVQLRTRLILPSAGVALCIRLSAAALQWWWRWRKSCWKHGRAIVMVQASFLNVWATDNIYWSTKKAYIIIPGLGTSCVSVFGPIYLTSG